MDVAPDDRGPEDRPPDEHFRRFVLEHKFGMDEVVTKLSISSRLKSPESLIEMRRKGRSPCRGSSVSRAAARPPGRSAAPARIS